MGRPLRFPIHLEDLPTPHRWRHVLRLKPTLLTLSPKFDDILVAEVVDWLRTSGVMRGGWRFVIETIETVVDRTPAGALGPKRTVTVTDIDFQIRFTRERDAFAFKLRWG